MSDNTNLVNEPVKQSFIKTVFNFDEDSRSEYFNMIQYTLMAIIPILILNKAVGYVMPMVDESKGSVELSLEVIIQSVLLFIGILIINKAIRYFPTYSGMNYQPMDILSLVPMFLVIMLSLQTRIGQKSAIVTDRVMEMIGEKTGIDVDKKKTKDTKGKQTAQVQKSGHPTVPTTMPSRTQPTGGTQQIANAMTGGGMGTTSTGLAIGGNGSAQIQTSEEYNFSSNTFTAAAWASGGVLGTARDEGGAAANAVSDAALYFGGYNGSALGITEEYNGSSWSEQNDLGTARSGRLGGAGTQTAGLCFGGNPGGALNEEYDGTSWTERGDLNTPRSQLCGVGISTAALAYGGQTTPSGLNNTEEYDGSSWTAQNTLNTARYGFSGAGLQTSALAFCGVQSPPTISNDTEEYNGTSWTSVNDMIQPAFNHGGSGAQTAALLFGGQTGTSTGGAKTSAAFGYDGTNWSTRPSMGTTRSQISGSSGTSNISAAAFGGTIPPYSTATEEFTGETTAANVVDITTS